MKIESFTVEGLFKSREPIILDLTDKNIYVLSGKNGAGKTTTLKLMWYIISGNLEKALIEVPFYKATLETDVYIFEVVVTNEKDNPFSTTLRYKNLADIDPKVADIDPNEVDPQIRHVLTRFTGSSFFLPTFRNIEGGFTTEKYDIKHELFKTLLLNNSQNSAESIDLTQNFRFLSTKLSNNNHKFITSVSSSAINDILISKYAEVMSKTQPFQAKKKELSDKLISSFVFTPDGMKVNSDTDEEIVRELRKNLDELESQIDTIKRPIKRFHESTKFFLKHYKFHFTKEVQFSLVSEKTVDKRRLTLSELLGLEENVKKEDLYDLSLLSAGEKQILMFISYNALYDNAIFFIDEPEISLHADWQRILFRILMKQNPTNQFIITTQSPFIYSKYSKNEICIDPNLDRGDFETE
ncbi:AAA family ATPase [Acinetobacter haemolyticus]|uniref:AAA family ATPase n=1 Tax=Acinetobacter haemolyticus TaxID=29430 RepID=UPI000F763421|nr:AAA family ATPase [Acinetobacter haemolyticus]AZN67695.1 ATP-binding protein [Acinetobacter haemolyticus]MCU4387297.1 ATP-binding protein [Acinetobacter haemolyticus]